MSRKTLGYLGVNNLDTFNLTDFEGVANLTDLHTLNTIESSSPTLFTAGSYGSFGGTTAINIDNFSSGYLIDGNANPNPAHAGAYKLTLKEAATIEFHIWAAGGPSAGISPFVEGGKGGYTKYTASFPALADIGLYLPGWDGVPTTDAAKNTACWPDAGHGGDGPQWYGYSGGGSARVGPWYSTLTAMNATTATYYAIAGGGGGAHKYAEQSNGTAGDAGHGGGSSGTDALQGAYQAGGGTGGTQTTGGQGGVASQYGGTGSNGNKYEGGNGSRHIGQYDYGGGGGGGGGYYGGGAGGTTYASGGGGSGYVNTTFTGYVSGATYAGNSSTANSGDGYSRPSGAHEQGKRGAIFFKKV
tara:strand:- start:986 stop:2056 length:1071 start_codon:yes stop_codon:yes gene_type:complete